MNLRKKKEKEMSGRAGSTFKESAEIFPFFLNSFIRLLGFFYFIYWFFFYFRVTLVSVPARAHQRGPEFLPPP